MSIKISFKKSVLGKTSSNLVLFVDEKFNTTLIKKYISNSGSLSRYLGQILGLPRPQIWLILRSM